MTSGTRLNVEQEFGGRVTRPAVGIDATAREADIDSYVRAVTRAQEGDVPVLVVADEADVRLTSRLQSLGVILIEVAEGTQPDPKQELRVAGKKLGFPGVLVHPRDPQREVAYAESCEAFVQTDGYVMSARVATERTGPDLIAGVPAVAKAGVDRAVERAREHADAVLVAGDAGFEAPSAGAGADVTVIEPAARTEEAATRALLDHVERHYADFDAFLLVTEPDRRQLTTMSTLADEVVADDADLVVGQSKAPDASSPDSVYQRLKHTLQDELVLGSAANPDTALRPGVYALSPAGVAQIDVGVDTPDLTTHLLEQAIAADLAVSVTEVETGAALGPELALDSPSAAEQAPEDGTGESDQRREAIVDDTTAANAPAASAESFIVGAESDTTPALSVVIPTMNEEEGIETCLEWVRDAIAELQVPTEIIVSDSSTDRTPELAREHGAIVIEPDEPGYGYAYRYAFERARGGYIVMGDADTTYDFSEIPRLLGHLEETGADIVMGSRLDGEIKPGAMPALHRYVGNPLLTRFLNTFYDAGVSDAHSGFRVFTADALAQLDLKTSGMEFASEMVMAASEQGLTVEEVPITYHEREGEETLDSFRDGWRHVRFMLVNAPKYLFTVPALCLCGLGVLTLVLSGLGASVGDLTFSVHTTIAGSLLLITGYQIGTLGIFSAIAGDPIKAPTDRVTRWVRGHVRLEHGIVVGVGATLVGTLYAALLVGQWLTTGLVPLVVPNLLAFTLIIIGVQTIFCAFFLSILSQARS